MLSNCRLKCCAEFDVVLETGKADRPWMRLLYCNIKYLPSGPQTTKLMHAEVQCRRLQTGEDHNQTQASLTHPTTRPPRSQRAKCSHAPRHRIGGVPLGMSYGTIPDRSILNQSPPMRRGGVLNPTFLHRASSQTGKFVQSQTFPPQRSASPGARK